MNNKTSIEFGVRIGEISRGVIRQGRSSISIILQMILSFIQPRLK